MINIYILEDDTLQQTRIEEVVRKAMENHSQSYRLYESFSQKEELLASITERGSHQLFFLDIELNGNEKAGFETARAIREMDPEATISFVTTHSEFMSLTFKYQVGALDFIDKNSSPEDFSHQIAASISYVMRKSSHFLSQDYFQYKSKKTRIQVPFDTILYIETSPTVHKVILHTLTERIEFYAHLSDISKHEPRLFKAHRSYLINTNRVMHFDSKLKQIIFENGDRCPVSRMNTKALLNRLEE